MVTCSAIGCVNRSDRHHSPGVTFHKFPTDPVRREQWVKAVKRGEWIPATRSVLCSAHFREEDFDRTSLCTVRLRAGAVPCIFPDPSARRRRTSPKLRDPKIPLPSTSITCIPVRGITTTNQKKEDMDKSNSSSIITGSKRMKCEDLSLLNRINESSLTILKLPPEPSAESLKMLLPHEFLEIQLGNSDRSKPGLTHNFTDPSLSISKVPKKPKNFEFKTKNFSFRSNETYTPHELLDIEMSDSKTNPNIIPHEFAGLLDPSLIIQKVPKPRKHDKIMNCEVNIDKPEGVIPPEFLEIQLTVMEDPPPKEIRPLLDSNEISIQKVIRSKNEFKSNVTIKPVLSSNNNKDKSNVKLSVLTEPKRELVEHSNENIIK